MKNFWRAVQLTLKYRFTITITVICALVLAFFWGANITAVLPLVEISFKGDTVREYWDQRVEDQEKAIAFHKEAIAALRREIENKAAEEPTASEDSASDNIEEKTLVPLSDYEIHKREKEIKDHEEQIKLSQTSISWFERTRPYVDRYAPKTPYRTVVALMIFVIAGTVIKSIFTFLHSYFSTKIGLLGVFELREAFFAKAINFEVDYYGQRGVSDTMSRFTNDMGALSGGITIFYGKLIREPLKLIVCLTGAAIISWQLLLFTFIFIPITVFVIAWLAKKLKKVVKNSMKEMVFMYARIGETFNSIRIIKVFNQEHTERGKFRRTNRSNYIRAMKSTKYGSLVSPITEVLGMTILIAAILLSAYLTISGETKLWGIPMTSQPLTLGEIILFYAFLIGASDPARRLSDIFVSLQGAVTAADRVYEVIDRENTLCEPSEPKRLHQYKEKISFENVSFSYDLEREKIEEAVRKMEKDADMGAVRHRVRYALRDIQLEIPFGETLAIIGPSGCGKSTLLSMIPRFIDPTEGSVKIDGISLPEMKFFDLRKEIGLITQTPVLFEGTVEENIRYGTYGAAFEEVVDAAKRAYAHDFIVGELADGYQTQVGPRGGLLSGGQMQRISIARAILKNPRILLLDEATSQIDMQSELLFHNALRDFIGNRTTVIVTHRTGALALADRIVIMNEGHIEQIGTHRELMKTNSYYAGLFVDQMENAASK